MTNTTKSRSAQIRDLLEKVEDLQKQQKKDNLWKSDSSPFAPPRQRARALVDKASDGGTTEEEETSKGLWEDSPFYR